MTIVIDDMQTEQLARQLASTQGVSITEVVRESLQALAKLRPIPRQTSTLRERLNALAREVDALPPAPANCLQDDEILGYDRHGV